MQAAYKMKEASAKAPKLEVRRGDASRRAAARRQNMARGLLALTMLALVCAVIYSHVQLAVLNDQASALKSQLSALQTENSTLVAQYERTFDLESLQAAVGSYMARPTTDQYIYIDLSEEDGVVIFDRQDSTRGVAGVINGVGEVVGNVVEYFRCAGIGLTQ